MKTIDIYRGLTIFKTVNIDEKTVFSQKLMNEHKITSEITVDQVIAFQIGDYILFRGEKFYINRVPGVKKINTKSFSYSLEFEGELYGLYAKLFLYDGLAEFSYTGNASDFLTLIISCMSTISSGWSIGTVDTSEEVNMDFNGDSCRTALTRVAEKFKMEFYITGRSISLKRTIGNATAYRFEYGRAKGLYEITRVQVSDQNIVTRVYGFGGTTNIPYSYRDGAKKLVFDERYLEKNVELYGVIEGQFTNDEIYPRRTGSVTAVHIQFENKTVNPTLKDEFFIEDSSINFDINENLLEGKNATIAFKSGDLSGQEFEIYKAVYDTVNNIKRLYFNPYTDNSGYTLPNALNQPSVGDQYVLVNLNLPQSYVDAAEAELLQSTQDYIDQNSIPKVIYSVVTDPKFVKTNSVLLKAGDLVTVVDTQLGINSMIRISDISFPLVNPNKINLTISDTIPYTVQQRIVKTVVENKRQTFFVDKKSQELARRNSLRQKQLKDLLFDEDQYFDATNIKPLSIESKYLSIGSKSSDFILDGVTIEPNFGGYANSIKISSGSLTHRQIEIQLTETVTLNTWNLNELITGSLSESSSYYLYAKCSKIMGSATWVLSTEKLLADGEKDDPVDKNFYFLVGVLFSVYDGARDYDFTFGMTYINGRTVTTGRIRSVNKLNYFDLDTNQFKLGNETSGIDWNVTSPNQLTIRGLLMQSQSGDTFPPPVFRGEYNPSYVYYAGDQVTYDGSTYMFKSDTPASGALPTDVSKWIVTARSGEDGTDGDDGNDGANGNFIEYQYAKNTSATVPPTIATASLNPTGWSTVPVAIGVTEYLWVTTAKKNSTATNLLTSWSAPVRFSGYNGKDGTDGDDGTPGDYYEYRYAKNGSTTASPSLTVTDLNPVGWLTIPPSVAALEYLWMIVARKNGLGTTLKTTWSVPVRTTPRDGTNGNPGDFTEFQYAKNTSPENSPAIVVTSLNPVGWSTVMPTAGVNEYVWVTSAKKNAAGTILISNWNTPSRSTGLAGSAGLIGPTPIFRGEYNYPKGAYNPNTIYYGTTSRVDIVKYNGSYFVARTDAGTFSGSAPYDTTKWNPFGAQFESVATELLFANMAYVDNLAVRYLRTDVDGTRIELNGDTGVMNFYNNLNEVVMSLAAGILTAFGAVLQNAIIKNATIQDAEFTDSALEGNHIHLSKDSLDFYNILGTDGVKVSATGIKMMYGTAMDLGWGSSIILHGGSGIFAHNENNPGVVTAQLSDGLLQIPEGRIVVPRVEMIRRLTQAEVDAMPIYSIYVDPNGRHAAKDGNGIPHTLW